jgi:hypothetical protein
LNKITIIIIIIGFRHSFLPKSRVICGGGWMVAEVLSECLSSVPSMELYGYINLLGEVAS